MGWLEIAILKWLGLHFCYLKLPFDDKGVACYEQNATVSDWYRNEEFERFCHVSELLLLLYKYLQTTLFFNNRA